MTTRKIFASTEALHRARPLADITAPSTPPTTIQPGVAVLLKGRPAISLTASGNGTVTKANPVPGVTSVTYANGGASLGAGEASFIEPNILETKTDLGFLGFSHRQHM